MVKAAPELNRRTNGHGGTELLFAGPPLKAGGASRRKSSTAPELTIRDERWEDETFSVRPPKVTSVQEHLLVEELRIKDENAEAERELRKSAADRVINIFLISNLAILAAVILASACDYLLIFKGISRSDDRLISGKVILALVGATTVQLGTVMLTIYRYLFPGPASKSTSGQ
jgi:hypothetical protein